MSALLFDLKNRDEDRINHAWNLVATGKAEGTGNVGLADALQTLHQREIDLSHVKLPGAYLRQVRLPSARLTAADLSRSDLSKANLKEADLAGTNLAGANLLPDCP
jgi:uncharacterized protein YjbI with pentapeptide repeats